MKARARRFWWIGLLVIAFVLLAPSILFYYQERRQAESDFNWFSTLGFPDVKGKPYVNVASGLSYRVGDEPVQNQYVNGFLLAKNAHEFKVFGLDVTTQTRSNTPPGTAEHARVGFEICDLRLGSAARLRELRARPAQEELWRDFNPGVPKELETFVLAWDCWREGLTAEALALYHEAGRWPPKQSPAPRKRTLGARFQKLLAEAQDQWRKLTSKNSTKSPTLREAVEKKLAHALMWRAVLAFEDPSVSRPKLLSQFEEIVRNYPRTEHRQRAINTANVLKRMIAEDEAHAENGPAALKGLKEEELARELIFQLRDQNGHQYSQPGWCDIFADERGTNSPAEQLVRLGYLAVPELIKALDSDTFTRSIGYHRNFYFSHTVLTVGDCAVSILHRITGRSFFSPKSTYSYMSKDDSVSSARKAAALWWEQFQQKGEQQMLVDGVAQGGDEAPAQAELLRQRYPTAATEALIRGAQSTTNAWARTRLIEQIAKLGDKPAVTFLTREMTESPNLQSRVAAAYGVFRHNRTAALAAMIEEWRGLTVNTSSGDWDWEQLVTFLATRDSIEAVGSLTNGLALRPVRVRIKVIESLGDTNRGFPGRLRSLF